MRLAAALLGLLLLASGARAQVFHVGETTRQIVPARARDWRGAQTHALVTRIWFPVAATLPERPDPIGAPGHALFVGEPVARGPLASARRRYPLILLSHGTGGSAQSLDWLGAGLARAGYIVVGVNHPGNNALEQPYTSEGFLLWWERAADLTDALDAVLADPQFAGRIDEQRIGAIGFSLGGYTVLELAGARTKPGALQAFCVSPQADAVCHPPEADRIPGGWKMAMTPETKASLARAGDSYRDPRVKAVFAVAPALGEAFAADSFTEVQVPVALLAGEADEIAPLGTNIRRFARFMPAAQVTLVPGAGHYTFLDVCSPAGTTELGELCQDRPGVDRAAVHALALDKARTFFAVTLEPGSRP
jgi:predicted dienelactone hydrolase